MDVSASLYELVAYCRAALSGELPIIAAMGMAGLVGGLAHCTGMCGPFVLSQAMANGDAGRQLTEFRRLRGAALLPYHLGRSITYIALGTVSALVVGQLTGLTMFSWLAAALMVIAAILFLSQALGRMTVGGPGGRWSAFLAARARQISSGSSPLHRFGLGLVLGFLPCGLLYAALAAAAATGDPIIAASAMAAFALGTVPALIGVGYAGGFFARRWPAATHTFAAALLIVNAGILGFMAWVQVA